MFPYPLLLPSELIAQVVADFRMGPSPPQSIGIMVRTSKSALHLQTQYTAAKPGSHKATMVLLHTDLNTAATKRQ